MVALVVLCSPSAKAAATTSSRGMNASESSTESEASTEDTTDEKATDEESSSSVDPEEPTTRSTARMATATGWMGEPIDEQKSDQPAVRMTLKQVLRIAFEKGREARIAREDLAREYQSYHFVRADYHPGGTAQVTSQDDDSLTLIKKLSEGAKVQLSQYHTQDGREYRTYSIDHSLFLNNSLEVRIASLSFSIAQENYRTRIEEYKLSVIREFFEMVRAQERLKTRLSGVGRAKDLVAFAKARYELGTANKIDVLNTQVDLANAENQVLDQRQVVAKTRDGILDLIGLPLDTLLEAVDPLGLTRPLEPAKGWYRSDLEAEREKTELARTQMNQALYRTYPDLKANATVYDDANAGQPDVVASIKYNFPIGTAPVDHEYRRLKHGYEISQYTYKNRQYQVAREQRDIERTLATKENAVKIAAQAVANAAESYEASQISFQRGIISSIDLRTSQTTLTNSRDNYISLLIDYQYATYQYQRLFGGDL